MTGKGHSWTGIAVSAAVYKFSFDFGFSPMVAVAAFLIGVTAPDWMEIRKSGGGTLIKHRTITHWLPVWILVFCLSFWAGEIDPKYLSFMGGAIEGNVASYIQSFFLGFSLGGLLHLLTDIPNPMGIPILTPTKRFSLKLWKSGKNEAAIVAVLFLCSMSYIGVLEFNLSIIDKYLNWYLYKPTISVGFLITSALLPSLYLLYLCFWEMLFLM